MLCGDNSVAMSRRKHPSMAAGLGRDFAPGGNDVNSIVYDCVPVPRNVLITTLVLFNLTS